MKSIKNQKSITCNFVDYSLNLQFIYCNLKKKEKKVYFILFCNLLCVHKYFQQMIWESDSGEHRS